MAKILKSEGVSMDGNALYDGKKTILLNVIKGENGTAEDLSELLKTLESIPPNLQQYILNLIENYKKKTGKEFEDKEESVFAEASKKGYSEGYEEGRKEALKLAEDGVKNIFRAADSIEQFKNVLYEDAKADVINLSLNIAQTIVKQIVSTDYETLKVIIADAVNAASGTANFLVHLNTSDYNIINKNQDLMIHILAKDANINFLPDRNILPGEVIIKTDFGEIDARIAVQIEQIKKVFMKITPD